MKWFYNLRLAPQIITLISVMAIFLGIMGFIGYYYTDKMSSNMTTVYEDNLLPVKWLNEARVHSRVVEALTMDLINIETDKVKEQESVSDMRERFAAADKVWNSYKGTNIEDYEKERIAIYESEMKVYRGERQKAIDMARVGKRQEANAYFMLQAKPHLQKVNVILSELADFNAQQADKANEQGKIDANIATRMILCIAFISIAIAFALGILFARSITKRLAHVANILNQIANGNLHVEEIKITTNDEIGMIGEDLNLMIKNLYHLIKEVATSAEQLAASSEQLTASAEQAAQASNQVASTIGDVANGMDRQLTSVEETSAVIKEIATGIQQVAVNSNDVASTTNKTASASAEGGRAVDGAIRQMYIIEQTVEKSATVVAKLGERSQEIGQIVEVISGIAGQTNLLALNAAIEAARAGEQGRGFAVVAEEVRKLAEQSEGAAKKIALLIREVQIDTDKAVIAMNEGNQEVKIGAKAVASAGKSFGEIADLIADVSNQVNQISSASQQMASGSQEIVSSIHNISHISKETASQTQTVSATTEEQSASVEEIAGSSRSLAKMAEGLQVAISKFKI